MKKYFVSFTYKKILPHSQELTESLLTFEIVTLKNYSEGNIEPYEAESLTKDGVLLALAHRGYTENVNIVHMNPL